VHGTLRVIGSIFQTLYPRGFQGLIGFLKLINALVVYIFCD
jgi:hypothetical protein